MFADGYAGELHVDLGGEANVVALVPATAELLSALAQGRADDIVRATALCAACPVVAAPAMHPRMWSHPATQRNVAQLQDDGRVQLIGPVDGEVASGESGLGRLAEPADIAAHIMALAGSRDLADRHVVVSAGPTVEDLDPARFLSNRSSGKMGYAIAARAAARGAAVTLVSGPVSLPAPHGVTVVAVRSALEMKTALWTALGEDLHRADALVMAAAVADFRPAQHQESKMKRNGDPLSLRMKLLPNPDLLAEIGAKRDGSRPLLVGFALETMSGKALIDSARHKLVQKRVDLVVANEANQAFDGDYNCASLVRADTAETLPRLSKRALADKILDQIVKAYSA
jgi:phosphopantothenoylcysteine decarboxylase/phosphopantothenate--cysteine ligase